MNPKQSKVNKKRQARAPYNFVPLPDNVIPAEKLLDQDVYHKEAGGKKLYTGRVECSLTTMSPLYTRTAMTPKFFRDWSEKMDKLHTDKADREVYAQFFHLEDSQAPVIPGSSLRGMVRSLMEVVCHGHMRWVADKPTFTFRAVAAKRDDPLRDPYQEVIGRFGRNVKAGYFKQEGKRWLIQPAKTPAEMGWPIKGDAYLKVKETAIKSQDVSNFRRLNSDEYIPTFHLVSFNAEVRENRGKQYVALAQIGDPERKLRYQGTLVCSGNMLETGQPNQRSPRRNHALVLEKSNVQPLPITAEAVEDYRAGMSRFQREELGKWGGEEWGCLKAGAPVFYVESEDAKGELCVEYFGHNPNFRIPAHLAVPGEKRAATPLDFVPKILKEGTTPDMTEAIFGWVEDQGKPSRGKPSLKDQRAGRVFFSDAKYSSVGENPWLQDQPMQLRTLSEPKPTTFQHYLVQDGKQGHNPDKKETLAHYGSSPEETQIRGYKFYWHKGSKPPMTATHKELLRESGRSARNKEELLPYVKPVKPGVNFEFTLYFENLHREELGALLWTLSLPGEPEKRYCHKLGMGKPLGMGAISIKPKLYLDDRQARYQQLFVGDQWSEASGQAPQTDFIADFEKFVMDRLRVSASVQSLRDVDRVKMLLTLLQWREGDAVWLDQTRYMEIEYDVGNNKKIDEYTDRPTLPDPLVVGLTTDEYATHQNKKAIPTQPRELPAGYQRGTVKNFGLGKSRSFGFVYAATGGAEIFVHRDNLSSGLTKLSPGQKVIFKVRKSGKQLEALDVSLDR